MKTLKNPNRRALIGAAAGGLSIFGIPESVLAQVAKGGVVVIGTTQRPRHLNPAVQSGIATMLPGAQIFATPMTIDRKWNPLPSLAEKWVVSDDARSITLSLRKDAFFHDGRPITSEDVQFSIETVRDNHPFKSMFAPVNAVTLPDKHTAVIRLSEPHPALALAMTTVFLPILPKHIYGDGQPIATHPRNSNNVVGSGPFRVAEFKQGEHLILERFDKYFVKGHPLIERLIIREYKDTATLLLALERGEIDIDSGLGDPREVERARKLPGVRVVPNAASGIGAIIWVAFNCKHPQLADKRVRKAVNYAIDRNFIRKVLFANYHLPATGPIASSSPFYTKDVELYNFDIARANKLLDEAGLPLKDGKRLALTIDFSPGGSDNRTIAEYMRQALAKVGIELAVRASPDFPTWARRVSSFEFDLTLDSVWNWGDPVIGVHRTYLTSNIRKGVIWSNTQQYSNPKVDELLAAAGKERDVNRRKALYHEFQKIVVDDAPIAYILEPNYSMGFGPRTSEPKLGVWGLMSPMDWISVKS